MKINFLITRLKCLLNSWKALLLYSFGNENRAIIEFENCLRLDPKNGPNLKTLGTILINKGEYLEGISKLEESLKYLPSNDKSMPEALAYTAYAYFKLDRLEESLNLYQRAIECWIKDGDFKKKDLLYALGRIYLQREQYVEAKDVFLEGLKLDDKEADIHFGIGISYFEIDQKDESLHHLEKAAMLKPSLRNNETLKKLKKEIESNITIH